jgi:hypothetical protein
VAPQPPARILPRGRGGGKEFPEFFRNRCPVSAAALAYQGEATTRPATEIAGSEGSYRVLWLRWMEERTVQQTADLLGLSSNQIRLREHRMKRHFRRLHVHATHQAGQREGRPSIE